MAPETPPVGFPPGAGEVGNGGTCFWDVGEQTVKLRVFWGFRIPPGTTSQQGRWALSWGKNLKIAGGWELPLESDIIPNKTLFSIIYIYIFNFKFLIGVFDIIGG